MKNYIILILLLSCLSLLSQSPLQTTNGDKSISKEDIVTTLNTLKSLSEKGITMSGDSVVTSKEFRKLLNNEQYRSTFYPNIYTWEETIYSIKNKELKKTFWFLINIYPTSEQNKELVLKSVLTYDQLVKMDEVLLNTFYTYIFADPTVNIITDRKPEIVRPDILEAKLNNVKEMITYIRFYRKQKES